MKKVLLMIIVITLIVLSGCTSNKEVINEIDYSQSMRDFVQGISEYSKDIDPDFIIIPQNGHELITINGEGTGIPDMDYLNAIDGIGREDLFYGYNEGDEATPASEQEYMEEYMNIAESNGIEVLVTDYCFTQSYMDNSYSENSNRNYISFAADHRELDDIPEYPLTPFLVSNSNINSLSEAKNFLYLLNTDTYNTKEDYISV